MADALKVYTVLVGGIAHTMQLTEADAKRRGLLESKAEKPEAKAVTPSNKSLKPANK